MAANKTRFERNVLTLQEGLRHYTVPTAILCFGALISILGFLTVLKDRLSDIELEFNTYASLEVASFKHNFNNYQRGLELVQRFFHASVEVEKHEFETFVNPLFGYGGFEAFWWIPSRQNRDFTIRYGAQDVNHFVMPDAISPRNFPEVFAALEKSEATQAPVASLPFEIENENRQHHHISLIYPLIKDGKFVGSLVGILDFVQVLKRSLVWTQENKRANVFLFNHPMGGERKLVYSVKQEESPFLDTVNYDELVTQAPFHHKARILLPSEDWELLFIPTQRHVGQVNSWVAWVLLICGLVISGLIGMFVFALVSRSVQVTRQVEKQTRELRMLAKDLSESEAQFRAIADNTIDGLITISEAGLIKSFNPACERIFGYRQKDVIGKNISLLLPEPYRSEYESYTRDMRLIGREKMVGSGRELKGKKKDGTVFPIELSISEVQLRDRKIYSGILRDISDRKQAESQLRKTADALAESNRELEQFAYVASHDLKAPLRGIDNLSKWLMEDLGEGLQGENRENLHLLRGRVARMEKLLDDLLEYSRLPAKSGKNKAVRVSGWDMLQDVLSALPVPKGFTVDVREEFKEIEVLDMPLKQIFLNLVSNSIKHHDKPDGHIEISFEDEGDYYHFRVSDDGPGIPRQFHNKVFQMFQTLKPRDEVEGSGIGLALVEKIIMHHGGEITLISDANIGTTFLFTWKKE